MVLETREQICDGLVDRVDPADGRRPRDDEYTVCVEGLVLRLPERVGLVPAAHVGIDDGHEGHRLTGATAHRHEEAQVTRVQHGRCRCGERRDEPADRLAGIIDRGRVCEQRRDRSRLDRVQTCFGAVQQVEEPSTVRHVEPDAVLVAAPTTQGTQLDEPLQLQGVGHLGQLTEVRLGGVGQRLDDLVTPTLDRVGITRDLVQQCAAA